MLRGVIMSKLASSTAKKRCLDTGRAAHTEVKRTKYLPELPSSNGLQVNSQGLSIDSDGYVHVYTDGACQGNGQKGAKAGIGVWFGREHSLNHSAPITPGSRPTNNVAEIQAAIKAIQLAKSVQVKKLLINTDSQFMINSMTKWIFAWKKNNWKTYAKKPVLNREEFVVLDREICSNKDFKLKWNHVPGHQGIEGNEGADFLAREGAKDFKEIAC